MTDNYPIRLTHAAKVTAQKHGGVAPVVVKVRDELAQLFAEEGITRQDGSVRKFMHCFTMTKDGDPYEFIATQSRDGTAVIVDAGHVVAEKKLTSGPLAGKTLLVPGMLSGEDEEMFGGLNGDE